MILGAILFVAAGASTAGASALIPVGVPDVISAAMNCYDAMATKNVDISPLTQAGWAEILDKNGKSMLRGGHAFRREGLSVEIVAGGSVCSLVAPMKSFDDVKAALSALDDAIHPDRIAEVKEGIVLTKGNRSILFWVGSPTNQTPAAVRIDVTFSEKK